MMTWNRNFGSRYIATRAITAGCVLMVLLYLNIEDRYGGLEYVKELIKPTNYSSADKNSEISDDHGSSSASWISSNLQKYLNVIVLQDASTQRAPYTFSITPWRVRPNQPRSANINLTRIEWSMVVFIKSRAGHFAQRERARSTWAKYEFVEGLRVETIFILGKSDAGADEKFRKENMSHGDILQTDIDDTYKNLIHKTIAGMQYASQYFPATWFYASADDDIIPDITSVRDNLVKLITTTNAMIVTNEQSNCTYKNEYPIYCGFGYNPNAMVMRATVSKWYVSKKVYSQNSYPIYCSGAWYSMSVKLVKALHDLSRNTNYFWIDDVWITGLLRLKYFATISQGCYLDDVNVGIYLRPRKVAFLASDVMRSRLDAKLQDKNFIVIEHS